MLLRDRGAVAFVVSGIVIAVLGHSPVDAFRAIVTTSFKSCFGLVETVHKWVPLVLLALAFTIPLAAGKYNIGGEGQLLVGATAAAAVGIALEDLAAGASCCRSCCSPASWPAGPSPGSPRG